MGGDKRGPIRTVREFMKLPDMVEDRRSEHLCEHDALRRREPEIGDLANTCGEFGKRRGEGEAAPFRANNDADKRGAGVNQRVSPWCRGEYRANLGGCGLGASGGDGDEHGFTHIQIKRGGLLELREIAYTHCSRSAEVMQTAMSSA